MDHKLSNSMKLWAMLCRATKDGRVMVEHSDKVWPTEEVNGKQLQYSCPWEPHEQYEKAKIKDTEDELPRRVGAQYATGD